MKKIALISIAFIIIVSCNNGEEPAPDVSNIKVNFEVKRFDQDFFSIDTSNLEASINALDAKYPFLLRTYLESIIGVADPVGIRTYYRLYKPVFDSTERIFKDFSPVKKEMEQAFRYVKHYFPTYEFPQVITPIMGAMNSIEDMARMRNGEYTPNFIHPEFIGISLQFYLGSNFSLYQTEYFINNVAPLFRSRRFAKEYLVADVMKVVVEDIATDKSAGMPLIENMIEKGKQWWLLDKFLPKHHDTIITGYKGRQLEWCEENEGLIWSYIVKNEDLNSVNPATLQTYIGESPFTQGFSQEFSPGNIGQWVGWQIVKKYAENKGLSPDQIIKATPRQILEEAKYKPK
jgi:hypothetical protein